MILINDLLVDEIVSDRKIIKIMFNASFFVIRKPFYFFNIILFLLAHDFMIFAR
jgi:hypothetical protein